MRVAFFQRIFAHYQAGLVKELAEHSQHAYHFFGDGRDPAGSGIEVIAPALCGRIPFTYCHTTQIGSRVAFQWRAVREALFGPFDVYIHMSHKLVGHMGGAPAGSASLAIRPWVAAAR